MAEQRCVWLNNAPENARFQPGGKPEINEILPSLTKWGLRAGFAYECWNAGAGHACARAGRPARPTSRLQRPSAVRPSEGGAMSIDTDAFVIGAGPAGLTAAYCLSKETPSVIVIAKDPLYVGGISRTVEYNGFMFAIGGHR